MKQLHLPINDTLNDNCEFIVSYCNSYAYQFLTEQYDFNRISRILLMGLPLSGKTRLARMWLKNGLYLNSQSDLLDQNINYINNNRIVIDNIHFANQIDLFNIINNCTANDIGLLLISGNNINYTLEDLISRLKSSYQLRIAQPDNDFILLTIQEMCIMYNISLNNNTINYIKSNILFDDFISLWQFKIYLKNECKLHNMTLNTDILKKIYDTWHRM